MGLRKYLSRLTLGDNIALEDSGSDPSADGEFRNNGGAVKVRTGGTTKDLGNIGTGDGGGGGTDVIASPNNSVDYSELMTSAAITIPVAVPDAQTLTVKAWGAVDTDGNTPSGLDVALVNPDGTDNTTANTAWNTNTNGIATYSNTSGSLAVAELEIRNNTGSHYTDPDGVGGRFGYTVA